MPFSSTPYLKCELSSSRRPDQPPRFRRCSRAQIATTPRSHASPPQPTSTVCSRSSRVGATDEVEVTLSGCSLSILTAVELASVSSARIAWTDLSRCEAVGTSGSVFLTKTKDHWCLPWSSRSPIPSRMVFRGWSLSCLASWNGGLR